MESDPKSMIDRELEKDLRIAMFAVYAAMGALAIYVFAFHGRSYGDPSAWASFGDFFNGVVSPAIGLVTVLLIVRTLQTTRGEARVSRKQFETQLSRMQLQHNLGEMQKRLDGVMAEWERVMATDPGAVPISSGEHGGLKESHPSTVRNALYGGWLEHEVKMAEALEAADAARVYWKARFRDATQLLEELATYCRDYERAAGDLTVADFYRRRVRVAAGCLARMGLIAPSVHAEIDPDAAALRASSAEPVAVPFKPEP